jgi:hypothetical protein
MQNGFFLLIPHNPIIGKQLWILFEIASVYFRGFCGSKGGACLFLKTTEWWGRTRAALPTVKMRSFIGQAIGKSARKVPYGLMNLQKFAHFHVLSAHFIALSRAI